MRSNEDKDILLIPVSEDHPALKAIRQDSDVLRNLSEVYSYPEPMPDTLVFGIQNKGEIIGAAHLKNIRWINRKTELTIYLAKEKQGRGIGFCALRQVISYIFNTINFHRIEAEVFSYNEQAIRLFEKAGFTREGVLREARFSEGRYYDILRFGLLKTEYIPD